ncbi:MAG: DMT family transporter [Candidatus Taylorbacteria bacterium]
MSISVGIGLAFIAMLCWGFGDFLIQKSARKVGDIEALFFVSLFGVVVLLPFVWKSVYPLIFGSYDVLLILLVASIVLLLAALFDFEALRVGKLSIIEPIWSFEVPMAAILAFVILGERITWVQILLIILLIIFLVLVGFKEKKFDKKFFMERGVIIAIFGAIFMGGANFFMGWGGRVTDPLMINFVTDVFITFVTFIILIINGKLTKTFRDVKHNYSVLLPMSISDEVAWIAFVFAMTLAPIAVATALSESYIIVAVLLGLFINKEKLQNHQKVGLVGAIVVALTLATLTSL